MLTRNPLNPRRRLTLDQRIMYLVTATHYLTGIAPGLLLLVPPLEIFFDLRPVNLSIGWTTWLLFYAGFYVLQILLAFYTLGSFRWEVLMLAAVSFPIYLQALYNALIGKEQKWHVTGSKSRADSPFNFIIPQVLVFVFLACTSVVALWRDSSNGQFSLATAWTLTNTFILGSFMVVALREAQRIKHPRPAPVPVATGAPLAGEPAAVTEPAFGQAAAVAAEDDDLLDVRALLEDDGTLLHRDPLRHTADPTDDSSAPRRAQKEVVRS